MATDMGARLTFGDELRRRRLEANLSLAELAKRVNYSKSHLCKIEAGVKRPVAKLALLCDRALEASGVLEALVDDHAEAAADSGKIGEVLVVRTADGLVDLSAYSHRTVMAAGAGAVASWAITAPADRAGGTEEILASFRTTFGELRRLGQKADPGLVGQVLIASTIALVSLANRTSAAARPSALWLASRYAEYTGWMAQERGNNATAKWWTDHAAELATSGGDRELASYALVRHAELAMYEEDAHTVVELAQRVQRGPGSLRVRSFAAQREAQGHAMKHNELEARRALDRAAEWMANASGEGSGDEALGSVNMTDPVAFATGWCLRELGQSKQASEILARDLDRLPSAAHRATARYGARLSLALVDAGEIDQACVVADPVIDRIGIIDSATIRQDLKQLRRTLARWHGHGAVREIMPRLAGALRTNSYATAEPVQ